MSKISKQLRVLGNEHSASEEAILREAADALDKAELALSQARTQHGEDLAVLHAKIAQADERTASSRQREARLREALLAVRDWDQQFDRFPNSLALTVRAALSEPTQ